MPLGAGRSVDDVSTYLFQEPRVAYPDHLQEETGNFTLYLLLREDMNEIVLINGFCVYGK